MFCDIPTNYRPAETEVFMCDFQKEYFRRRLLAWRDELLQHAADTFSHLKTDNLHEPDEIDNAVLEEELSEELLLRDREAKLLVQIDEALERLENGTYGFCEETGEPIGVRRLEASLLATHCIEVEEVFEKNNALQRHPI